MGKIFKGCLTMIGAVVVIGIIIAIFASGGEDTANENNATDEEQTSESTEQTDESTGDEQTNDSSNDEQSNESNEQGKEETPKEEPAEPQIKTYDAGMYEVGSDIEPGVYFSPNASIYAARLSGFSGSMEDVIANTNPSGQWYLEIESGDKAVQFDSGNWVSLEDSKKVEMHEKQTTISDGIYKVGLDIEPGKYKMTSGSPIYWARLKDASMEMGSIIANGNPTGQVIVEVQEGEYFEISGGTYELME